MISELQAQDILSRYKAYEGARERFDPRRYKRGGGYTPADKDAIERMAGVRQPSNDELGELEFYNFMTKAPDAIFAYYKHDARVGEEISNFPGKVLGAIVWRGQETRPLGGRMVSIRMRGVNGFMYAGKCNLSSGTYCRLRKMSGKM